VGFDWLGVGVAVDTIGVTGFVGGRCKVSNCNALAVFAIRRRVILKDHDKVGAVGGVIGSIFSFVFNEELSTLVVGNVRNSLVSLYRGKLGILGDNIENGSLANISAAFVVVVSPGHRLGA
jgi:hypothetical protein